MPIASNLLPEYDHEMKTTRSLLERVPDGKADWKPHAKSMSMGQLAAHLPGLVRWISPIVTATELDVMGPAAKALHLVWVSNAATLAAFDQGVAQGRAMLAEVDDDSMMQTWKLMAGSHELFSLPRVGALRTMVWNHIIHHRGQLSVYLRLNDVPLPDIYGPTADSVR